MGARGTALCRCCNYSVSLTQRGTFVVHRPNGEGTPECVATGKTPEWAASVAPSCPPALESLGAWTKNKVETLQLEMANLTKTVQMLESAVEQHMAYILKLERWQMAADAATEAREEAIKVRGRRWRAADEVTELMDWNGQSVRIRKGWGDADRVGKALGGPVQMEDVGNVMWLPVLWSGDEDPDWHKLHGLEVLL